MLSKRFWSSQSTRQPSPSSVSDEETGRAPKLWTLCFVVIMVFMMIFSAGCGSATQRMSTNAQAIQTSAVKGKENLTEAQEYEIPDPANNLLNATKTILESIHSRAGKILDDIPKVEDREHPLLFLLRLWGWVILILAVVGGLIYLGVGRLSRRLFSAAGWLIPRHVREEAENDVESMNHGNLTPEQIRRIEIRKQMDPTYRAAFKQERERMKEK